MFPDRRAAAKFIVLIDLCKNGLIKKQLRGAFPAERADELNPATSLL
jgi:hypothetical protein